MLHSLHRLPEAAWCGRATRILLRLPVGCRTGRNNDATRLLVCSHTCSYRENLENLGLLAGLKLGIFALQEKISAHCHVCTSQLQAPVLLRILTQLKVQLGRF